MTALASVHRFRGKVAVYLADGRTVYLKPAEARKFARALTACARDIKEHDFINSEFHTVTIPLSETNA